MTRQLERNPNIPAPTAMIDSPIRSIDRIGELITRTRPGYDVSRRSAARARRAAAPAAWPTRAGRARLARRRVDAAEVADAGAEVDLGVGVDDLVPAAGVRQAEPVVVVRHGGEVRDAGQHRAVGRRSAGTSRRCPAASLASIQWKPAGSESCDHSAGVVAVDAVEVADQPLHAAVVGRVEQPPVQRARLGPLGALRELLAHEQQLLARVRPHVGVQRAQRGHLLPPVARDLVAAASPCRARPRRARSAARSSRSRRTSSRTSSRCGGTAGGSARARCSSSVSCIQPMFHLKPKPEPAEVGRAG